MLNLFQEQLPAVRCISCGEPRHKTMPLPSGLGSWESKIYNIQNAIRESGVFF
jgi:hypothetical protein